ncbi:MAG TPA: hypothetical protein VNT50_06765 [Microbacterium sp.]|uniref:hypothetical protein n=1 Tax=Microbacterium sp. TaxID=51671 RepID=UPI002CF6E481|nr:hypothetical protein [Microbacterium sp.]HWI31173.1 hypothetical protein [Microbacterium sp.]
MDLAAAVYLEGAVSDLYDARRANGLHGGDYLTTVLHARALDGDLAERPLAASLDGVHGDDRPSRARDRRGDLAQHAAGLGG